MPAKRKTRKTRKFSLEARARMSAGQRKRYAKHRRDEPQQEILGDSISPDQVAYAVGRIEGWLIAFAEGLGVARDALTTRVARALLGTTRR